MIELVMAVDFDGTCVEHTYPQIGVDVPYAVESLRYLREQGVKLILWTMRSGEQLEQAKQWYKDKGIELWGVNENPEQEEWTYSPKAYAHMYIDDAAVGCPLLGPSPTRQRPVVDWIKVMRQVCFNIQMTDTGGLVDSSYDGTISLPVPKEIVYPDFMEGEMIWN